MSQMDLLGDLGHPRHLRKKVERNLGGTFVRSGSANQLYGVLVWMCSVWSTVQNTEPSLQKKKGPLHLFPTRHGRHFCTDACLPTPYLTHPLPLYLYGLYLTCTHSKDKQNPFLFLDSRITYPSPPLSRLLWLHRTVEADDKKTREVEREFGVERPHIERAN